MLLSQMVTRQGFRWAEEVDSPLFYFILFYFLNIDSQKERDASIYPKIKTARDQRILFLDRHAFIMQPVGQR